MHKLHAGDSPPVDLRQHCAARGGDRAPLPLWSSVVRSIEYASGIMGQARRGRGVIDFASCERFPRCSRPTGISFRRWVTFFKPLSSASSTYLVCGTRQHRPLRQHRVEIPLKWPEGFVEALEREPSGDGCEVIGRHGDAQDGS